MRLERAAIAAYNENSQRAARALPPYVTQYQDCPEDRKKARYWPSGVDDTGHTLEDVMEIESNGEAAGTGTLWSAVREQPVDAALEALKHWGFKVCSASLSANGLLEITMTGKQRNIRLYGHNGRIGMVDTIR